MTEASPRLLRLWLPPQFDPLAGTPSADLLRERLQTFEAGHPGLRLEVRVKAEADILRTLSITASAAPEAMPDLIALSYSNMQAVASAGLLHPLEGLTSVLQDPDWYAFARDLGHLKNVEYGIPFACDALTAVYRPSVFEQSPSAWRGLLESGSILVFPASDPRALFPLSLYLSDGGSLVDEQGAPALDAQKLARALSAYREAIETGLIPPQIRDFQTDAESLQFYRQGQADVAVIWASSDLQSRSGAYGPLPGLSDLPYSLGDGWVWALAGSRVESQPLAAELASYLVESEFMSAWTRAAGLLPTRPQALNGWEDGLRSSLTEVIQSTHAVPPQEVLSILGPLLQEALARIFNGEQPDVVARSVVEALR